MPEQKREDWKKSRSLMELNALRRGPLEKKSRRRKDLFSHVVALFKIILKFVPIRLFGVNSAGELSYSEEVYRFEDLPKKFDNLRIIHLSDLHLDERPDMIPKVNKILKEKDFDLIVVTGDLFSYTINNSKEYDKFKNDFYAIFEDVNPKYGIYSVLGNHDSLKLVNLLESSRVKFLCNQIDQLKCEGEVLQIIGTDDPHYFFSDNSIQVLKEAKNHFSIALIHSPELSYEAAEAGIKLYLCGHTHGGQIRWPFNYAPVKRVFRAKKFYYRRWNHLGMNGFTSTGIGTSAISLRINTKAEVVCQVLKCK